MRRFDAVATVVIVTIFAIVFAFYLHALYSAHAECDNGVGHVVKNVFDWPVCLHNK